MFTGVSWDYSYCINPFTPLIYMRIWQLDHFIAYITGRILVNRLKHIYIDRMLDSSIEFISFIF